MYCVGLTGSIASGKSTVADIFSELGIEIISADKISRMLTEVNQPAFHDIVHHFGESILTTNGELNRLKLRHLIFDNPDERKWLESILHPLIRKEIEHRVSHCKSPYVLIEIPLLTDKTHYPYLNRILLVTADTDKQIKRLMERDNCSKEHALAILDAQPSETKRRAITDDIIVNDHDLGALSKKVNELHQNYLKNSEQVH